MSILRWCLRISPPTRQGRPGVKGVVSGLADETRVQTLFALVGEPNPRHYLPRIS